MLKSPKNKWQNLMMCNELFWPEILKRDACIIRLMKQWTPENCYFPVKWGKAKTQFQPEEGPIFSTARGLHDSDRSSDHHMGQSKAETMSGQWRSRLHLDQNCLALITSGPLFIPKHYVSAPKIDLGVQWTPFLFLFPMWPCWIDISQVFWYYFYLFNWYIGHEQPHLAYWGCQTSPLTLKFPAIILGCWVGEISTYIIALAMWAEDLSSNPPHPHKSQCGWISRGICYWLPS